MFIDKLVLYTLPRMNQVALITGASRGIGRGIALELAAAGFDLVINFAENQAAADETVKLCTERAAAANHAIRVKVCQADVGQAAHRERLIRFTRESLGRLDLLVNNAGINSDATEENWDALMAINLKGPFFLSQLAARWMVEQFEADASRKAKIVNISSVSAYAVSTNRGDYCVAKAGLGMVTRRFATRLAEHGINVYEVCPGVLASALTAPVRETYDKLIDDGMSPIRRWGEPGEIGKAVVALAHDYFPFTTGEVFNVDGGFNVRKL